MNITVNGKPETVPAGTTLRSLLEGKGVNPNVVACELNGDIVRRKNLGEAVLTDRDTVEIIQMIGGG